MVRRLVKLDAASVRALTIRVLVESDGDAGSLFVSQLETGAIEVLLSLGDRSDMISRVAETGEPFQFRRTRRVRNRAALFA